MYKSRQKAARQSEDKVKREEAIVNAGLLKQKKQKQRQQQARRMKKRTSKGQPIMKFTIENLVAKLEQEQD